MVEKLKKEEDIYTVLKRMKTIFILVGFVLIIMPLVLAGPNPRNGVCPTGYEVSSDGTTCIPLTVLPCNYTLDKSTYYVGETVRFIFQCPYYRGLKYIVKWQNTQGYIYEEDSGEVDVINIEEFKPDIGLLCNVANRIKHGSQSRLT